MLLLKTPHVRSEYDASRRLVRYTRTPQGFLSLEELESSYGGLIRSTQHLNLPTLGLLIDIREAPPRNDPAFEKIMARYRVGMMRGFHRVAILVQSAVGRLQVRRYAQDDGILSLVTQDEEEALQYLAGGRLARV